MTTMSRNRVSPEAGWVTGRRPTGPNGRPTCRRCGGECPKGRRTFCGDDCVHEHRIRTDPGYVRALLRKRDQGVCRACGRDTEAWSEEISTAYWAALRYQDGEPYSAGRARSLAVLAAAGVPASRFGGALWDADHIVEVVEGGGECGLDNYQTLCIPCHRRKTADLARQRAEQRRAELAATAAAKGGGR